MKPLKTKDQVRAEIEKQIDTYIDHGGAVTAVDRGISGREVTTAPPTPVNFDGPKTDRTPVNDVVAAIESRRKPTPAPKASRRRSPKRKMVLDDFGQPLRWEWVEE